MIHTNVAIASRLLDCRDVDPPREQRASTFCTLMIAFRRRGVDVVISVSVTRLGQYAYRAARDA